MTQETRTAVVVTAMAAVLMVSGPAARAQRMVDEELLADSASEASLLAAQISVTASIDSGDTRALLSFREKAAQASDLLELLANEDLSERGAARALFDQIAPLVAEAIRLRREGAIRVDPAIAEEFVKQIDALQRAYYGRRE